MEKKFHVLRVIGTLWKVLAWIFLIGGILLSLAILLAGILGSGGAILRLVGQDAPAVSGTLGLISGLAGFALTLISALIYFLLLYAVGDLISLLLAIEENTRTTVDLLRETSSPWQQVSAPPPAPGDSSEV